MSGRARSVVTASVLALASACTVAATSAARGPEVVTLAVAPAAQEEGLLAPPGLMPPTSARYADPAWYEIVDARLLGSDLLRLQVELGAIDPSGALPLGITQPIIELYLDTGPGGAGVLLPGSGMRMPDGEGWNIALRITGDGAWAWLADETGAYDLNAALPLDATASGRTVHVLTPFVSPTTVRLYAITGVYDPFRPDGWRPLARTPSPWAFSSTELAHPVVAIFPGSPAAALQALQRGELPRGGGTGIAPRGLPWFGLMFAGIGLAFLGLWWRRRVEPTAASAGTPAAALAETARLEERVAGAAAGEATVPSEPPAPDDETQQLLIAESEVDALLSRLEELAGHDPAEQPAADARG